MLSAALCEDGGMFLEAPIYNQKGQTGVGFAIFSLNRASREWHYFPRPEDKWGRLYGCDGTHIGSAADDSTISWVAPPRDTIP